MKTFDDFAFDPWQCRRELAELSAKIAAPEDVSEHAAILDWFQHRKHLSAFIGAYFPYLAQPDRLAYQYDLFGDFRCDIALGDSESGEFCFVALGTVAGPDWPEGFEQGVGRVLDWFWKLSDTRGTNESLRRFGPQYSGYQGILITGLESRLDTEQKKRLAWRREHLMADGKHIHCVTYDELHQHLDAKLRLYEAAYRIDLKHSSTRASLL